MPSESRSNNVSWPVDLSTGLTTGSVKGGVLSLLWLVNLKKYVFFTIICSLLIIYLCGFGIEIGSVKI